MHGYDLKNKSNLRIPAPPQQKTETLVSFLRDENRRYKQKLSRQGETKIFCLQAKTLKLALYTEKQCFKLELRWPWSANRKKSKKKREKNQSSQQQSLSIEQISLIKLTRSWCDFCFVVLFSVFAIRDTWFQTSVVFRCYSHFTAQRCPSRWQIRKHASKNRINKTESTRTNHKSQRQFGQQNK